MFRLTLCAEQRVGAQRVGLYDEPTLEDPPCVDLRDRECVWAAETINIWSKTEQTKASDREAAPKSRGAKPVDKHPAFTVSGPGETTYFRTNVLGAIAIASSL